MRRVLITGAGGFVGRHCLSALEQRGFEVHAAVGTRAPITGAVRLHRANLLEPAAVTALVETVRPTHLLHLAWCTSPGAYWTSPENQRWVTASLHLLRTFAASGGRRAVLVGSCAEYDWRAGRCYEVDTPLRPATLYGRCKAALGAAAEVLAGHAGLSLAWARLFFLYGPHEYPQRLVPSVARALLAGVPAPCTTGGQQRDFLHVADAADALVAVFANDLTGPVNIASGLAVTVREVVDRVAAIVGRPDLLRPGALPVVTNEPTLLVADVERLRQELGWTPHYSLTQGLAQTVAWWEEQTRATAA